MSRLQELLVDARRGLVPWEPIPRAAWPAIAAKCGEAEREEIAARLAALRQEHAAVPEWDGDTQDDIWRVIELFEGLLALSRR
ncbi:MAG TPA: hypothetical protein VFR81_16900 [Longimicrobium sp.]|nr:hypothetical protein [Longimicrobium sp.]